MDKTASDDVEITNAATASRVASKRAAAEALDPTTTPVKRAAPTISGFTTPTAPIPDVVPTAPKLKRCYDCMSHQDVVQEYIARFNPPSQKHFVNRDAMIRRLLEDDVVCRSERNGEAAPTSGCESCDSRSSAPMRKRFIPHMIIYRACYCTNGEDDLFCPYCM